MRNFKNKSAREIGLNHQRDQLIYIINLRFQLYGFTKITNNPLSIKPVYCPGVELKFCSFLFY